MPVAIYNSLVLRNIIISANEKGQSFSESMDVLKKSAYGVSGVQGPRVLRTLSTVGSIISNEYAVQAEISVKLAKQVSPFVPCHDST